ncbi:MAG TPA: OB-fold nucleic acid binding domain-containing protein [Xanthobacteraceae bacterium]|nr:OB-fold nucleic acid binding domain-containing protein [Xanthobacteraceae bacterium]
MRVSILVLSLSVTASAALAEPQTIAPVDVKARIGQTVTVEGTVSDVHVGRSGAAFIDIGGRFPDNALTAVIFVDDLGKFPGAKALAGKQVAISGPVKLYQGKPEIILKSADQLKTR